MNAVTSTSEDILKKLRDLKPHFKEMNLKRVRVFGSVARGEATKESDLDLIVDFYKTPSLFKYIGIENKLSDMLGIKVDMGMENSLHPMLKEDILKEARDV